MTFVQVVDFRTSRFEELKAASDRFQAERNPETSPVRVQICADRDDPGRYLALVEFASYEAAAANNDEQSTQRWAATFGTLIEGEATYLNMDRVVEILD